MFKRRHGVKMQGIKYSDNTYVLNTWYAENVSYCWLYVIFDMLPSRYII